MHLTPEEKAVGKENFNATIGETRRDFLKKGLAAGLVSGGGLGAMYFGYGDKVERPLRLGVIGTGDEGSVLMGALNPNFAEVVAIADIRPYNRHRAFYGDHYSENALRVRPGLCAKYGWKNRDEAEKHVKVYKDRYEDLLDDKNVEAVIIALPLHLHSKVAVQAMRKGKHVLTEKLMAHSVHECKEMSRVAYETGKLLATGHQRHYSILYDNAVDTIKRGLLGDLHYIRAQWHRGNLPGHDSWSPALPPPVGWEKDPDARKKYKLIGELVSWTRRRDRAKGAEFDKWAAMVAQKEAQIRDIEVKAENYGYQAKTLDDGKGTRRSALEELIRWRLWNRTSAGLMAELGGHQLDAASIFISSQRDDGGKVHPLSVSALGGRHIFPMDRECDDHVYCIFEFPNKGYYKDPAGEISDPDNIADPNKKIVVTYSSINGSGYGGYGEIAMGTKGTLVLEREQDVMLFLGSNTTTNVKVKNTSTGPTLDTTQSGGPSIAQAVGEQATAGPVSRGYTEELEHWIWCIRELERESKGKSDFKPYENLDPIQLPRCQPKVAMADAVIALTSNIAMAERRHIDYKPEWFDIFSDETPEGVKPRKV